MLAHLDVFLQNQKVDLCYFVSVSFETHIKALDSVELFSKFKATLEGLVIKQCFRLIFQSQ